MSQGNFDYEYKFENTYDTQNMDKTEEKRISFSELGQFKIDPSVVFVQTTNHEGTFIDCEVLDLHSCGNDIEDAKKDLLSEIEFVWDYYVNGKQDELGSDAKAFAKRFAQHVTRI